MPGLTPDARQIINTITNQIRDQYGPDSVLKELVQNADDAGAERLTIIGMSGLAGAVNPLLLAPGLLVLNDGGVSRAQLQAMTRASGSDKAGDVSKAGRFGLGQKSLFNLCDAFVVQCWLTDADDALEYRVINPYVDLDGQDRDSAARTWDDLSTVDHIALTQAARGAGLLDRGVAIYIPLRSALLRPAPGAGFSNSEPNLSDTVASYRNVERLGIVMAASRNLQTVTIMEEGSPPFSLAVQAGAQKLEGPSAGGQFRRSISGTISKSSSAVPISFSGEEQQLAAAVGARFTSDNRWPSTIDEQHHRVPEKAAAHAAAVLSRMPDAGRSALHIHWAVFLPIDGGRGVHIPLHDASIGRVDILLHGYFFVDSGRRSISFEGNAGDPDHTFRAEWNAMVRREATLPLILPAILRAFADFGLSLHQKRAMVKALGASDWWREVASDVAGRLALAECLDDGAEPVWALVERAALRPLPRIDLLPPAALGRLLPDFRDWAGQRGLRAAFDAAAVLASSATAWEDVELAALLDTLDPKALQRSDLADHLAVLLEATFHPTRHPLASLNLVSVLRRAFVSDAQLASPQSIAKVTEFMPSSALFALPRSVENRTILRALANTGGAALAVRYVLAPGADMRILNPTLAIDWLESLEELVAMPGDLGDQANATVAAILAAGPSLAELSENDRARHLRVVRVRRVGSDDNELLTIAELVPISDSGRLFNNLPGELLRRLAAAVPETPLYVVRLNEDNGAAGKLQLQSPSSTAAAAVVLRSATVFGPAIDRGLLLVELLRDEGMDRQVLRALCVDEPVARMTGTELMSLGSMPAPFADMTTDAVATVALRRIVPQVISDHFSSAARERLGVREIGLERSAAFIVDAHREGGLRPRTEEEAKAVLGCGLDWNIVSRLPVFNSNRGLVAADVSLFRDGAISVPASMRHLVAVHEPWTDPSLRSVQGRIPEWTAARQVEIALVQESPMDFTREILDGLESLNDAEIAAVRGPLRDVAWVPNGEGAPLRGGDILSLDAAVDAELRLALPNAPFAPFDLLPAQVRDHSASDRLRNLVFAGREESLEALALQLEEESDLFGCVVDPVLHADDLNTLAGASVDLRLSGWPLLSAILRSTGGMPAQEILAASLTGTPSRAQLLTHMNSVAAVVRSGQVGEAARRIHRAAFQRYISLLLGSDRRLAADLMLPSQAGTFRRADMLALRGRGVAAAYELDRFYAAAFAAQEDPEQPIPTGTSPTGETDANLDVEVMRSRFAEALRGLLGSWRRAVPSDAVVFLLGLMGRDPAMRSLAVEWEADTRSGAYQDIWDALDADLAPLVAQDDMDAVLSRTLFTARIATDEVEVQSAAGTLCVVPLAPDDATLIVGNPSGTRRPVVDATGIVWHHVDLAFVLREPTTLELDRPIFQSFIEMICPTIMLALPSQRSIVLRGFARSFEIDQVTIEDTIAKLRDQSPTLVRTLVVPDAGIVRTALAVFERVSPTDHAAIEVAKSRLWNELQTVGAARELLVAVRSKIGQMGYAPSRVLFELFQNADDAYVQNDADEGRIRLEVQSSTEDENARIRFVHWGRPINHPGTKGGGVQGYHNDLYNMLAINHSEKPMDAGTTGKFGLGFKTVHMVTGSARVASGFVGASIVGGLIPEEWPAGIEAVRGFARGVETATLIDVPVDTDCTEEAVSAVGSFLACVEWLPSIAGRIRSIEIDDPDGERAFATTIDPLPGSGIAVVRNSGHRARRAMRLDLGEGFFMLIAIGRSGPEAIVASSSLWNLVPLEEQAASGWLINGPFDVDPGRSHIKGTPEQQAAIFAGLGAGLGDRLVELYDMIDADPATFAGHFDFDVGSVDTFWTRLATFFEPDLLRDRELRLHHGAAGIGHLWTQRPSISTGLSAPFDEPLSASDVRFRTTYALSVPTVFEQVVGWPVMRSLIGTLVSETVGNRLAQLSVGSPNVFTLRELVNREIGAERRVTMEVATRLGTLVTLAGLETSDLQPERTWLLAEIRNTLFLSKAGTWVEVNRLAIEAGGEGIEHMRAAFAPDGNILSDVYSGSALDFFKAARSSSGFGPNAFVMRGWAESAIDPIKRTAFLRYLLHDNAMAVDVAGRPMAWLPSPLAELRGHVLLGGWTAADVTLLLALFQQLPPYVPPLLEPEPLEPYDRTDFLEAIHDWWIENGAAEGTHYDELAYPPDFDFGALRENDSSAWFTMFALAIFQTIGRTEPQQNRAFVDTALREGWWNDLASFADTEDLDAWIARLDAWSDPDAGDQTFITWRRCLVDLYAVAKYLPGYIRLIRALPRAIVAEGPVALQSLMRPYQSSIASALAVTAPAIDRSIGMGMNWLIRELIRHDVFDEAEMTALYPYAWNASARARRLLAHAQIELPEPGRMDETRSEFAEIVAALGPARAIFGGDLDLPLQLIAREDFLSKLLATLVSHGLDPRNVLMDDDG